MKLPCRLLWLLLAVCVSHPARALDCVVLLHGLARTPASMGALADAFTESGYRVVNMAYPSRSHPIEALAPMAVEPALKACGDTRQVHFVTHSLGGILLRHYLAGHTIPALGRAVMLAPPNQGSEVVDALRNMPGFRWWNGPAGLQLGTSASGVPRSLPPVDFPLGVIAGTRSINLLLSTLLPDPDDGKLSVAATRVEGMTDFVTVPYSHPLLMRRKEVIELCLRFIASGSFSQQPPP